MLRTRIFLIALSLALLSLSGLRAASSESVPVAYGPIKDQAFRSFAISFLTTNFITSAEAEKIINENGLYGSAANQNLVFLTLKNKCDFAGCLTHIFEKEANGFKQICSTSLSHPIVLGEEESGLPLIQDDFRIIHWQNENHDYGGRCWFSDPGVSRFINQKKWKPIRLKPIDDNALRQHITSLLEKGNSAESDWEKIIDQYGLYAETDTNPPLIFFKLDNIKYCGTAGCTGYIFRRTPNGLERICNMGIISPAILSETQNGLPLILKDGETLVHWHSSQPYDSGELCWWVDRESGL